MKNSEDCLKENIGNSNDNTLSNDKNAVNVNSPVKSTRITEENCQSINAQVNIEINEPPNVVEPNIDVNSSEENLLTPKVNAFQYMMDNRHKSIGRNSPGKEIDLSSPPNNDLQKRQLKARKAILENWAELKGTSKRKREYEEKGAYILYKLEKRAKKLKNMLQIDSKSDDELIIKKKGKCLVIESDSEEDACLENTDKLKGKGTNAVIQKEEKLLNHRNRTDKNDLNNRDSSIDQSIKVKGNISKSWKMKIKLSMDENIALKTRKNERKSEINEQTENVIMVQNGEATGSMTLRSRKSKQQFSDEELKETSDDELQKNQNKKKQKTVLKVAPVFLKAVPKPKVDPEVLEARRQFLLSGVPDSIKRDMVKQQSNSALEEINFEIFPTISHVQQKTSHNFWNLPKVDIEQYLIKTDKSLIFDTENFCINRTTIKNFAAAEQEHSVLPKIKNYKKIVNKVKSQNPNYPVYRIFKSVYNKSGYKKEDSFINAESVQKQVNTPKRRGRKKKKPLEKIVDTVPVKTEENVTVHAMWTEKYKAKSSCDIIGNMKSVSSLKEWLTNWLRTFRDNKKKKFDSDSEFDTTDGDSRDSMNLYSNTLILKGPHGSGKTSSVYAVSEELGFSVLEVNASSRRTGKWLLQELQEATQSHQVRKKEGLALFVKEKKKSKQKMCVLLIEDVDVIFDQDEGFVAALMQIISTTKRPLILTATDDITVNLQKVVSNSQTISFSPLSSVLAVWLQIVCLVEGCYVDVKPLEQLLNYNRGDVRKTLLHLQYWVNSGGHVVKTIGNNEKEPSNDLNLEFANEFMVEDEHSNMSDLKLEETYEENVTLHSLDLRSFTNVKSYKLFDLPGCNNLEVIWWNLPHLLNFPNKEIDKVKEKQKVTVLSEFYDSLSFVDTICDKSHFHESLERIWRTKPKDSLILDENMENFSDDNIINDLTDTMLSGRIKIYKEKFDSTYSGINLSVPSVSEKRWLSKQIHCHNTLREALLHSSCLERMSTALDYMPALRSITRSEFKRAVNNNKRRSRCYSYLKNLGVFGGETVYKSACNIFCGEY